MHNTNQTLVIIIDRLISFLSNNIWVIFLVVFIIIFRESLSDLFKRVISFDFSFGNAKGEIRATAPEENIDEIKQVTLDRQEYPKELGSEDEKVENDAGRENWFIEMHSAFKTKEYDKAIAIFENYLRNEINDDEKIQNESIFLYFLYTKAGDKNALERLRRLVQTCKDDRQRNNPLFWLSACYKFAKNFTEAEKLWNSAIDEAEDEEVKTQYICNLAGALKDNNKIEEAAILLEHRLKEVSTDQEKIAIYRSIAEVEKTRRNYLIAALALERIIELVPDDRDLLFECAYTQSEAGLQYLSIDNYDTLVMLDPEQAIALNNIGVAAEDIGLNSKAIKFYQQSIAKGNTLAMANLAQRYLNSGFIKDAKRIIEKAKEHKDVHENVPRVISAIHEAEENEKESWEDVLNTANKFRKSVRRYVRAYFCEDTQLADFSGTWHLDDNKLIELKIHNNILNAEWQTESGLRALNTVDYKCLLSGKIHNNSALITYRKEPLDKSSSVGLLTSLSSTTSYECFAYINPEKNEICIFSKDPKKEFALRLYRKST